MKKKLLGMVAAALIGSPFVAQAAPVYYDLSFGGNALDADGGTGSFVWDDTTRLLSNLVWDLLRRQG